MDKLFKQLAGSGSMGNLQDLFSGGPAKGNSQEEDEELLEEADLMENARISYDIYIQNSL
jgi:hypothetical protein